ncbi:hypothetical protein GUJ93_ZPchr0003g16580 [Zizania palustris]|uniref:Uncharacterized protein n=1 Tax=Zizania palustris TaxID=103762 RepID=A0A8J5SRM8_ZIZPA|nr:hypothetical protein GUJ93_ZPchr0003g16580 [Zizania palustris]
MKGGKQYGSFGAVTLERKVNLSKTQKKIMPKSIKGHKFNKVDGSKATLPFLNISKDSNKGSPQNGPSLDPSEILIAIRVIDPEKQGIPLNKDNIHSPSFGQNTEPTGQESQD